MLLTSTRHNQLIVRVLFKTFVLLCLLFGNITTSFAAAMPDWLMTPPVDSDDWFYTVGSGESRSDAQKNALAELAGRIQINVQTSTQQFVEAKNKNVDYYLELDNAFASQQMSFNNVDIVRSYQDKKSIYVLAKVDRDSFFEAKHKAVLATLKKVDINSVSSLRQQVAKFVAYNWQKQAINNEITLLSAYNINTDILVDLQNQIESASDTLVTKLNLETHIPSGLDNPIKQQLALWLTKSGLSLDKKTNAETILLVVTQPNSWIGKDKFNHVNKVELELVILLADEIIDHQTFSAQAFAADENLAKELATEQLVQQLQTN